MAEKHSSHKDSIAWQKGMRLTRAVYSATRNFPSDERFGLTNQLRRAAVSVPSNIAEGKGRQTTGELIQFLCIARGSLLEVQTQLELAEDLGFASAAELSEAHDLTVEIIRMLNATIATLRAKIAAKKR